MVTIVVDTEVMLKGEAMIDIGAATKGIEVATTGKEETLKDKEVAMMETEGVNKDTEVIKVMKTTEGVKKGTVWDMKLTEGIKEVTEVATVVGTKAIDNLETKIGVRTMKLSAQRICTILNERDNSLEKEGTKLVVVTNKQMMGFSRHKATEIVEMSVDVVNSKEVRPAT